MLVGYARISTNDQNLRMQEDALKAAGCEELYTDIASGVKAERPGLNNALSYLGFTAYPAQTGNETWVSTTREISDMLKISVVRICSGSVTTPRLEV